MDNDQPTATLAQHLPNNGSMLLITVSIYLLTALISARGEMHTMNEVCIIKLDSPPG